MTRTILLLLLLIVPAINPAAAGELIYPTEYWVSPTQGWVVETKPCGASLCGYLVGFRIIQAHPPGYVPLDVRNPNPSRRAEPLCGLLLMGGFRPSKRADNIWDNGWIYNPDTGDTYSGKIEVVDTNTVKLRGYVGVPLFGRTLVLNREIGPPTRCAVPEPSLGNAVKRIG